MPDEPDWDALAADFTTTASESSTLTMEDMMLAMRALEDRVYPRIWQVPVHPREWQREFNRLERVPDG